MSLHLQSFLRKRGYDPTKAKTLKGIIELIVARADVLCAMKNNGIGNPEHCSGAYAILRETGWEYVAVGAKYGYGVDQQKNIWHFSHNGRVARRQDEGWFPIGEKIRLRAAYPSDRLHARSKKRDEREAAGLPRMEKVKNPGSSPIKGRRRESMAAELRRQGPFSRESRAVRLFKGVEASRAAHEPKKKK